MKKKVDGVEFDLTPEEIAHRQAEEAQWESVKNTLLFDKQLAALFDALTVEARARFYVLRAAVSEALRNRDIEAAKLIIGQVEVPDELKEIKNQMLEALKDAI